MSVNRVVLLSAWVDLRLRSKRFMPPSYLPPLGTGIAVGTLLTPAEAGRVVVTAAEAPVTAAMMRAEAFIVMVLSLRVELSDV